MAGAEVLAALRSDPGFRRKQREGLVRSWTPERKAVFAERLRRDGRRPPSALGTRRGSGSYVSQGYRVLTGQQGHPLAASNGLLHEHRAVLYTKIGPGVHLCHWGCGRLLHWGGHGGIHADHVDGDTLNNSEENLVPSCVSCNRRRGAAGNPLVWNPNLCSKGHELDGRSAGRRYCRTCHRDRARERRER